MNRNLPIKISYKQKNSFPLKRSSYKNYFNCFKIEDVIKETQQLKENNKNFLEDISKKYGIAKRTLSRKINLYNEGKDINNDLRGKHTSCFSIEEEEKLANKIKSEFIDKGKPFGNSCLKILAEKEWKILYPSDDSFKANCWCANFKKK